MDLVWAIALLADQTWSYGIEWIDCRSTIAVSVWFLIPEHERSLGNAVSTLSSLKLHL